MHHGPVFRRPQTQRLLPRRVGDHEVDERRVAGVETHQVVGGVEVESGGVQAGDPGDPAEAAGDVAGCVSADVVSDQVDLPDVAEGGFVEAWSVLIAGLTGTV